MAKYWEGEYDINTDWGGDESTGGKPLPGSAVQDVIKTSIKKLDTGKVGYITESDGTVYFSSSKEAFDNEDYMGSVVSTQRYSMDLKMDVNNRYVFLSSDTKKEFVWYFKTIEIATDSVYTETVTVEYKIENKTENVMKTFSTTLNCNSDDANNGFTKVVMNLDEYLTNGLSSIEIVVKGLRTKQERTLQKDITIVTLDIEDVTDFSKPFENRIITQTNINCTKGQLFFYEYRIDEAEEFVFDNTAFTGDGRTILNEYSVDITSLSEGRHVFEYKLYINIGGKSTYYTATQRIEFVKGASYTFEEPQVLLFSTYSSGKEHIAEDGNLIINGASQYVPYDIKYAIYNSKASTTNAEFYDISVSGETIPVTVSVERGKFYYYSLQSMEYGSKKIKVICKDIDDNVLNGDGRIFYVDVVPSELNISIFKRKLRVNFSSVGKSNDSVDKDVWVSNVQENGFVNTATFSDTFDWSQGWTSNGLVISNGCEVMFDYAPFPQQKDSPTVEEANEYVGGDKAYTFEIEFMTQNVTDESAVLCDMSNELNTNKCGLLITGSEIKFTTPGGETVSSRFKEGDMNRATIVIHPETTSDGQFKGLVELYMNGVMSSIAKYSNTEKFEIFERDENGNAISKRLRFKGTEGADLVVKYVVAYNTLMTPDEVVNNYIIYRDNSSEMLNLYNKNNIMNEQGVITPNSVLKLGNIPILIFVGRTVEKELATGDGNINGYDNDDPNFPDGYKPGKVDANEVNWYGTLEATTNKKQKVDMDVIYYNPLDKTKNFKFVKAYITPQGTSSMYYPKKNYRIYTQKNADTRCFFSIDKNNILELDQMLVSNFGEKAEDRVYEKWRGTKNKKKRVYSFKDNAQAVKCWCLKADFAETSSSHNTGVARLWGDTLKNSTVTIDNKEVNVFKTTAQSTIERIYNNNVNGDMPDIRTTIDGFPIVVFGARSYGEEFVFLGKYNFNNDKSTESVFGFCDIDNENNLTDNSFNYDSNVSGTVIHTLDKQLDQYMSCVETLDNGNALANFSTMDEFDEKWEDAFEFRYPEIVEEPDPKDYQDSNGNWADKEGYDKDYAQYLVDLEYWKNTHLKPFKHFAEWIYSTKWCDVNGDILEGLSEEEAKRRREKFATEKWQHIDVWKMAAYYIYLMRFGAVDQVVKNSMLTSEGPFAFNKNGVKYGEWDSTDVSSPLYGRYYKWYYINYDNDTVMGVKNDGSLKYGPEITRKDMEGEGTNKTPIYAGYTSTLWNNIEYDEEFQDIIRVADRGISKTLTYKKAIEMFDVEQVGKWCERIYNKDAEYKYISPYMADWKYSGSDDKAENFTDKLFMLQGSRTAHRRWWLSRRFNLFDGKWSSGDYATKFVEVKCNYGSIGDKFSAIAGANAYFGYQINNKTFGDAKGGVTQEYKANTEIEWELRKVINIGDPIAIYGSNDILELNLQGISKNLSSVAFHFGDNEDLSNKLERLILGIKEEDLVSNSSYKAYTDDEVGTVNGKTGFEKLKLDYPFEVSSEADFEEGGIYPTVSAPLDANNSGSPKFYRVESVNDDGETVYTYFVKISGGVRNYACNTVSFDSLNKLQALNMAGYMGVPKIDLSKNKFITDVDVRYSSISSIDFSEGSRIKTLKVSDKLTTLAFNRCDNVKLQNIYVNASTLTNDGGKNINTINVNNSTGLNHSNAFKDFIIRWMKSGDVSTKSLILRGIKWTNVTIDELEIIKQFLLGDESGKHAIQCVITGTIEMGPEKVTSSDLEMFDELVDALGGSLSIKIPYANVILNKNKTEIVAGESAEYYYTLFPDASSVISGGGVVEYYLVKEVSDDEDFDLKDDRTNIYYKIVKDPNEVRKGIKIVKGSTVNSFIVKTEENIVGGDTNAILMASLTYDGSTKFDVAPLLIKEPTYAVSGVISGSKNIGDVNTSYSYDLSIISNANAEPIGTIEIEWGVSGSGVTTYFSDFSLSEDKKTYTITTSSEQPNPTGDLTIYAKITNHDAATAISGVPSEIVISKPILLINKDVVLTKELNPTVFDICQKQGWATESPIVMTRAEAEAVTNIGTVFANVKADPTWEGGESGWTFDEFMYFTNAELDSLENGAFANSELRSISFPPNITSIGDGAFENCSKLETVQLVEGITVIPEKCFLNCANIVNFRLPDTVEYLMPYSFGGTNMKKIVDNKSPYVEGDKTIIVSENSNLMFIENDAFETERWSTQTTTNKLSEILLPKNLRLRAASYNFVLGTYLSKIKIMDIENTFLLYTNNMLYADRQGTMLVRALPKSDGSNVLEEVVAETVTSVYDYAFFNCETVKKIGFGGGLVEYGLGKGAFYNSSVEIVDLSRCSILEEIKENTFSNCGNLTEVIFPIDGNLKYIGPRLFENCLSLSSITFPNTIIEFKANGEDSETFSNCALEELVLPQSLTGTGRYIVSSSNYLKRIVYPDLFKHKSDKPEKKTEKFKDCSVLEEVVLPIFSYSANTYTVYSGDTIIGVFDTYDEASSAATENNEIRETISEILVNDNFGADLQCFENCPNLKRILLNSRDSGKIMEVKNDGYLYKVRSVDEHRQVYETDKMLSFVAPSITDLKFEEGTKIIGAYCFSNNNNFSAITIPSTVTEIGSYCFNKCSSLTKLHIYSEGFNMSDHMCFGCEKLEEVFLRNPLNMGSFAFVDCSLLKNITILNPIAPQIESTTYHPFGFRVGNYTGDEVVEDKIIYLPYNRSGYDAEEWRKPLIEEGIGIDNKVFTCNFVVNDYPLDGNYMITVYYNGELVNDSTSTIYLVSDSGDYVVDDTNDLWRIPYNVSEGGFVSNFFGKVYENETVKVYLDRELTTLVGEFVAHYGKTEYTVGLPILGASSNRSLFTTNLFASSPSIKNEEEMANVTKAEYENLIARVSQLTEIINRLTKK